MKKYFKNLAYTGTNFLKAILGEPYTPLNSVIKELERKDPENVPIVGFFFDKEDIKVAWDFVYGENQTAGMSYSEILKKSVSSGLHTPEQQLAMIGVLVMTFTEFSMINIPEKERSMYSISQIIAKRPESDSFYDALAPREILNEALLLLSFIESQELTRASDIIVQILSQKKCGDYVKLIALISYCHSKGHEDALSKESLEEEIKDILGH